MWTRCLAALGVLLIIAGCAPGRAEPGGFGQGPTVHTIAGDRTYRLYVPAGLPSPAPLVVMLHGGFGSAQQAERAYGWDQLADTAKFVVAYPDGLGRAWNSGGGCCGRSSKDGVDDVGFITAAVADIGKNVARRPVPDLCHRDQQWRHDGLRIGVQHGSVRGDRPRFGDPARSVWVTAPDVGAPHPRHGRHEDSV